MKSRATITSMDDLKAWFDMGNSAEWNLYRGHQDKLNGAHLIASQRSTVSMEESWDQLNRFIDMNTRNGGDVTVYIPGGGNGRGYVAHYSNERPGAMAGVGQPGAMMGAWGMGYIPMEEQERREKALREKWEMERRIEDLEAENESRGGIWGPIVRDALSGIDVNQLIKMAYVGFMAKFNPGAINPQISINGMDAQPNELDEEGEEENPIERFITRTRRFFNTDEEYLDFLDKVATFFEKQPDMCKGLFK